MRPPASCQVERQPAAAWLVHIELSGFQQQLSDGVLPSREGIVERGAVHPNDVVAEGGVGSVPQQQLYQTLAILVDGMVNRSHGCLIPHVGIRPPLKKQLCQSLVVLFTCNMQGRLVHVSQRPELAASRSPDRPVAGSVLPGIVLQVGVRPVVEEQPGLYTHKNRWGQRLTTGHLVGKQFTATPSPLLLSPSRKGTATTRGFAAPPKRGKRLESLLDGWGSWSRAISTFPDSAARWSAVLPPSSASFTSAPPASSSAGVKSSRAFTMSGLDASTATCRGLFPFESTQFKTLGFLVTIAMIATASFSTTAALICSML
mmetsp:Transcript_6251/g.17479  ORF Transcript_6251/g.17479 Transcript_6251/m.17479 type:complete len:316 (+) Transcript_6251:580-1527(+)